MASGAVVLGCPRPCPKPKPTAPLQVGDALEEERPYGSRGLGEVLEAHAAELLAVHVEVLEGDAGGVDLVHVQRLLQPLPHLEFGPELGLGFLVPGTAWESRNHGGCWGGVGGWWRGGKGVTEYRVSIRVG